jgi:putative DNA primase/helicase
MAKWAVAYNERLDLALTWTQPGAKGPRHTGWNLAANAITKPSAAFRHWTENPAHGIAVLLGPSRLVSLDIDNEEHSRTVLRHFGVNLDELRSAAPCIVGRHFRLIYRAPDVDLKHRTLAWPKPDHADGSAAILEFRAGLVADTLPPTVHPGTRHPYRWENPPRNGFPPPPARLVELCRDWPTTQRQALELCPWAKPSVVLPPSRKRAQHPDAMSVIDAFNSAHDVSAILEAHGYRRRGKRFASPDTRHAAGVVLMDSGKIFCHQAGDPLADEHAHDAFDLYRLLEHGGCYRSAVKAAAEALRLGQVRARGVNPL